MKKSFAITILVIVSIFLSYLLSQQFSYVGVDKCKICHKTDKQGKQHPIWEESKHSKSVAALSSPEAASIAKEMGADNPAESPKCFKCHAPLFEKAPELKAEGVTCEVCHGPGSAYKTLNIMKSREESVTNGMNVYNSPEEIKKLCLTCHAEAHNKPFDFAASWEKIKHLKPEGN